MTSPSPLFVVDANVLIDYADADPAILALMALHVGPIHVPRRILQEVRAWSASDCEGLGLVVVTEDMEEITQATASIAGLSFPDRLVLAIAVRRSWSVITNDGRLRKVLTERSVGMRWGLEMMLELVRSGHLPADQAIAVAERICKNNQRIKPDVLVAFCKHAKPQARLERPPRRG